MTINTSLGKLPSVTTGPIIRSLGYWSPPLGEPGGTFHSNVLYHDDKTGFILMHRDHYYNLLRSFEDAVLASKTKEI